MVLLCKTEVQTDGLDVTDVEIAIWLWWEAGDDCIVRNPAVCKIVLDYLLDEVKWTLG